MTTIQTCPCCNADLEEIDRLVRYNPEIGTIHLGTIYLCPNGVHTDEQDLADDSEAPALHGYWHNYHTEPDRLREGDGC